MPAPAAEMTALWNQLRAVILTVWPQIGNDGIYRVRQLSRKGFDQPQSPFVIVMLGEAKESDFSPVNAVVWEPTVTIFYVKDDEAGVDNADLVENELNALAIYLRTYPLDFAQVLEVGMPDAGAENPANVTYLKSRIPRTGGSIDVRLLFGRIIQ